MAYSLTSFSDTSPSAPSSGTPTAAPCSASAPPTDGSPACTCTRETSGCSIHPPGRDAWIACMRASLARTSARLALARAYGTELDPVCGERLSAWPITFDRSGSCWRTAQESLVSDSTLWSETWPRSGTMRNGTCWPRPMLAPTMTASGGGALRSERRQFGTRIATCPTPTRHEFLASEESVISRLEKHGRVSVTLAIWVGGPLNPAWVEWLMGWPIGWTASPPSATARSRSARRPHGICSEGNEP